jgi:hypothetical protein
MAVLKTCWILYQLPLSTVKQRNAKNQHWRGFARSINNLALLINVNKILPMQQHCIGNDSIIFHEY